MTTAENPPIGLCPDPYCRICKDATGEIRDGLDDDPDVLEHPEWVRKEWQALGVEFVLRLVR
jgi:hypothetical protein